MNYQGLVLGPWGYVLSTYNPSNPFSRLIIVFTHQCNYVSFWDTTG